MSIYNYLRSDSFLTFFKIIKTIMIRFNFPFFIQCEEKKRKDEPRCKKCEKFI